MRFSVFSVQEWPEDKCSVFSMRPLEAFPEP
jgi:hypothetical protein